jgi:hypothetical protein
MDRRCHDGVPNRRGHSLLFLALADEAGNLIWISAACCGAASEIMSTRTQFGSVGDHLTCAGGRVGTRPAVARRRRLSACISQAIETLFPHLAAAVVDRVEADEASVTTVRCRCR